MRSASFHFAMRSERENEPTLSCSTLQPTARWTMVTSSVSPERAETMAAPLRGARGIDRGLGLAHRADLVRLDQDGVAGRHRGRAAQPGRIGDQEIVADDLHAVAGRLGESG